MTRKIKICHTFNAKSLKIKPKPLPLPLFSKHPKHHIQIYAQNNINISINTFKQKNHIVKSYMKSHKELYKPIINDIKTLYENSINNKNNVKLNIILQDYDQSNNDPNYIFLKQKEKYQNINKLGSHKVYGYIKNNTLNIESDTIYINIYSPSSLIHEFGHTLDHSFGSDDYLMLSLHPDFEEYQNLFINEVNNYKNQNDQYSKEYYNYISQPDEIFTQFFTTWYDINIHQPRSKTPFKTMLYHYDELRRDNKNHHLPEEIAYKLYKEHPEIEKYFDKQFGQYLDYPQFDYLKNKSLSDKDLLNKLKLAENTSISKTYNKTTIDIDY